VPVCLSAYPRWGFAIRLGYKYGISASMFGYLIPAEEVVHGEKC
jgi:hypothetical protein